MAGQTCSPLPAAGPRRPTTSTAWPGSSTGRVAWPRPATPLDGRSNWPRRAAGAASSRISPPASGPRRAAIPPRPRRCGGRSRSWTRCRASTARPADDGPPAPPAPDPLVLTLAVEEALEAGDLDEARRRALVAATAHRAVGQLNAAMDACYQALAIAAVRPGRPPAPGRALPRSRLARPGRRQAGAARPAYGADRRCGDAGAAMRAGGRPLPRRSAPDRGLRLTLDPRGIRRP